MASVEKFNNSAVNNELRHSSREIKNNSNTDIDPSRSHLNYSLTPDHGALTDYQYYRQRLSSVYIYNKGSRQSETVTAAGWIVTLPDGEYTADEQRQFFEAAADFLSDRYGGANNRNTISINVHYDEGKIVSSRDEKGEKTDGEMRIGRAHLHYIFVPTTIIDHEREAAKRWHDPKTDIFEEKLCANDVLTRADLKSFHDDLQHYLDERGLSQFAVRNGKTAKKGYSVEQLKERTELNEQIADLQSALLKAREEVKTLALENADIKAELARLMDINRQLKAALEQRETKKSRWEQRAEERAHERSRW